MSDSMLQDQKEPPRADVHLPDAGLAIIEPEDALPRMELEDLPESLRRACALAGWSGLTPIQSLALPYPLNGRDIMAQSRTGSGKTGCYLLPMLEIVDPDLKKTQALVLAPTRELALQVEREAGVLFQEKGLKACAIYGGVGFKRQLDALHEGAQVIIGTPGRILDHILRRSLDLSGLRTLVFDEADRMLSIGFYRDMREIARHVPEKRQTMFFSATYPPRVLRLAEEFMAEPRLLSLSARQVHVAEVEHLFCPVQRMDKDRALVRLLEAENPSSALIFCNTRANVHYVAEVLKGFGYNAEEISADLPQKKREAVLERIREGGTQYLVATDVASRGIDIPDLSHVFLYEPPEDQEGYIHRAGRTGRAGAGGVVISLVDVMERLELERIAKNYRISLRELPLPDDKAVADIACQRLEAILESRLRQLTGLERIRSARYEPLARELAAMAQNGEENAVSLVAMLLDAGYRESLGEIMFPPPRVEKAAAKPAGGGRRRSGRKRRGPRQAR